MKHEDAFLQAVQADPDNEQVRQVYADWLEERGDQRAELIRVMQEMAALPVYSDRHAELRPRRDELRARTDKTWLERMGYLPTHRPLFTHLPERRVERWRLVEEFIGTWYQPVKAGDGATEEELQETEQRLGFRLPAALREWHALAGRRKDVWSVQDHLVLAPTLKVRDNALFVYLENQSCEVWGIRTRDLQLDDPPVYRFWEPARVSPTLTAFSIYVLLRAVQVARHLHASGSVRVDTAEFREARRGLKRCKLPERYWAASDPIRHYEGQDLILETGGDEYPWTTVTARTEAAYERLGPAIRQRLERHSLPSPRE